jgi:hypothetical protein
MLSICPADWLDWSVGGALCIVFLWLISVPPACDRDTDAIAE